MAQDSRNSHDIRELIEEAILVGRALRDETAFWGGLGRHYRKKRNNPNNKEVAAVAKKLYEHASKAYGYSSHLIDVLRMWQFLRIYSWPIFRLDMSDVQEFWKLRFQQKYTEVEEETKQLILLVMPERYDEIVKDMAARRPKFEVPDTPEAQMRASVDRFKRMLRKMKPVDPSVLRRLVGEEMAETKTFVSAMKAHSAVEESVWACARGVVAQLPETERAEEMTEIESLLKRAGFNN